MGKKIRIEPVTRIEGHAGISVFLDANGKVADTRVHLSSLRGFEKFIQGTPAEEIPRIVTRICGICPWMHHLASVMAVEQCFGVKPTATAEKLRELGLLIAHVQDKLLHFFFLAAPDFLAKDQGTPTTRTILNIAKDNPEISQRIVTMRRHANDILEILGGKAIHPVTAVPGGFAKTLSEEECVLLRAKTEKLYDLSRYALAFADKKIIPKIEDIIAKSPDIETGFLGMVGENGAFELYHGALRLMRPDGGYEDFPVASYKTKLSEETVAWSHGKMVYAASFDEGFSLDPAAPKRIYRVNTLARLNVADFIPTQGAQEALEAFRDQFGRPAQHSLHFHQARLIELLYVCERSMQLLQDEDLTNKVIRNDCKAGSGSGIGCVEAPRGTLIHEYQTDDDGCILSANMIVGTTHNIAPIHLSVHRAAQRFIKKAPVTETVLNQIEMAMRAYDP